MLIALHNLRPCLFCGIGWKEVEHTTRLQPDALASDLSSVYLLGKNSSLCRLDSNTPTITYKGIWFEVPMHTQVFDLKNLYIHRYMYLIWNTYCKKKLQYMLQYIRTFFIPSSEEVEMVLMLLDMENQAL